MWHSTMDVGQNDSSLKAANESSSSPSAAAASSTSSPLPPFPPPLPMQEFPFSWRGPPAPDVARFTLSNAESFYSPSISPAYPLVVHNKEGRGGPLRENETSSKKSQLCARDSLNDGHTNALMQHSYTNPEFHQTKAETELLKQSKQNQFCLADMTFCPPTQLQRQQHLEQQELKSQRIQMNIMSNSLSGKNHDPLPLSRAALDDTVLPTQYFSPAGMSPYGNTVRRGFYPLQLPNNLVAEKAAARIGNGFITNRGEMSTQSTLNAQQSFNCPDDYPSILQRKLPQSPNSSCSVMATTLGRSQSDTSGDATRVPQHHFLRLPSATAPRLSQEKSILPPLHGMHIGKELMVSPQATMNIPEIAFDNVAQLFSRPCASHPPSKFDDFVVDCKEVSVKCGKIDSVHVPDEKTQTTTLTKSTASKATDGDAVRTGGESGDKQSVSSDQTKEQQDKTPPRAFALTETEADGPAHNTLISHSTADGVLAMQTPTALSDQMVRVSPNPFSNNSLTGYCLDENMTCVLTTATVPPQKLYSQKKSKDGLKKTRRKLKCTEQKKATRSIRKTVRDNVNESKKKGKESKIQSGSQKQDANLQLALAGLTTEMNPNAAPSEQTPYASLSMPYHCNTLKSERISPSLGQTDVCANPFGSSIAPNQTLSNDGRLIDNVQLPVRLQTETDALSTCSFSASQIDSDDQDLADTFSEQRAFPNEVREIFDVDSRRIEIITVDEHVIKCNSTPKEKDVAESGTRSSSKDVEQDRIDDGAQSVTSNPTNLGETGSCEKSCAFNVLGVTSDNVSRKRRVACQARGEYAGMSLEGCREEIEDRIPRQKFDEAEDNCQTTKRSRLDSKTHNNSYSCERPGGTGKKDISRLLGGLSRKISKSNHVSNEIQEESINGCSYQREDGEEKKGRPTELVSGPLTTNESGSPITNIDTTSKDSVPNRISDSAEVDRSLSLQPLEIITPETGSAAKNAEVSLSESLKDGSLGSSTHGAANVSLTTLPHKSDESNASARTSHVSVIDSSRSDHSRNLYHRCLSKHESAESKVILRLGESCQKVGFKGDVVKDIPPPSDLCKVVPRSEKRLHRRYPLAPMGQIWLNQSLRLAKSKVGTDLTNRGTLIGRRWVWDEGYFIDAHFSPSLTMKKIPLPSGCTCGANHEHASPKFNKRSSSISDNMNTGRMRRSERSCTSARMASVINQLASGTLSPHTLIACEDYAHGPEFRFSKTIATEDVQPFLVRVSPDATFLADLHAHLCDSEIIGFLGGRYSEKEKCIYIQATFPCKSTDRSDSGYTDVEMDPVSQIYAREAIDTHGMSVVGWYHSHPTFQPDPSVTDIENQANYQHLFAETSNSSGSVIPFVGLIVGTYDSRNPTSQSVMRWFHVRKKETATYKSVHFPMNLKTTDRRFRKMPHKDSSWQQAREEMSIRGADIRRALEARYLSCPLTNSLMAKSSHDLIDAKISDTSITDRESYSGGSLACKTVVVKEVECDTYPRLTLEAQINDYNISAQTALVNPSPEHSAATIHGNPKSLDKKTTLLLSERLFCNNNFKAKDPSMIFPEARPLYFTENEKSILDMQFGSASYDVIGGIIWHAVEREQLDSSSSSNGSLSLIPLGAPASSGAIFELILRQSFTSLCGLDRRLYDIVHCIEEKSCDDLPLKTAFNNSDAILSHNVDVLISHYLSKSKKLSPFSSWNGSGDKGNIFKCFGSFPSDDDNQWRDLYFTKILQMQRVETNGDVTYQGGTKMRRGHKVAACLLKWASYMQLSRNFCPRAIDPDDNNTFSFDHEKEMQLRKTQAKSGSSQNAHYYFVAEVMRLIAATWRESEDRSSTPIKRVKLSGRGADQKNGSDNSAIGTLKTRRKSRKKKLDGQN
ncbi:hypothetical protein ACHAWX_004702 [Stephanocyclus meneghinianus]